MPEELSPMLGSALNYFLEHEWVTVRDLFNHCFINSPTKVISELRKKGFNIIDHTIILHEADGSFRCRYKEYRLEG